MELSQKIKKIREKLEAANTAYYVDQSPIMSDMEYDLLMKELRDLEEAHPEYKSETSPTEVVGGGLSFDLRKIKHRTKMLSLDNICNREEFDSYAEVLRRHGINPNETNFYCDLKMDGISVEAEYHQSKFQLASSRGDGLVGEDLTENVLDLVANGLPKELLPDEFGLLNYSAMSNIAVRGECTISNFHFLTINESLKLLGEKPIASPRHMVSALLRTQKKNRMVKLDRVINFNVYGVDQMDADNPYGFFLHSEMVDTLASLGFHTIPGVMVKGFQNVWEYYQHIEKTRYAEGTEIDGVVFRINSFLLQDRLGTTNKVPKYAMALKFKAQQGKSVVTDIIFQVGRTGILTPVVVVNPPVELGGVFITRSTLHNEDYIRDLDLRLGDTIVIERSGDVIPKVVEVDLTKRPTNSVPYTFPTHCPICDSHLTHKLDQVGLFCSNEECPAIMKGKLIFIASRDCYDLIGFGNILIENLYDRGLLHSALDYFRLTYEDLASTGMGAKRCEKCVTILESRKSSLPLEKHILGLMIPGIGRTSSKLLANHFTSMFALSQATHDELLNIPTIGYISARSIIEFFNSHPEIVKDYVELGLNVYRTTLVIPEIMKNPFFTGKRFEITGRFDIPRSDLIKKLESVGAIHGSLASADYLLVGENPSPGKIEKANKKQITLIDSFGEF